MVEGEEKEARERRRRDFKAELKRTGLAEHTTHLEVVGRVSHRTERGPVAECAAAHLGQARHRCPRVGGDNGREPKTERARRDRPGLSRRKAVPCGAGQGTTRAGRRGGLTCLQACRCQVHGAVERQRGNCRRVGEVVVRRRQDCDQAELQQAASAEHAIQLEVVGGAGLCHEGREPSERPVTDYFCYAAHRTGVHGDHSRERGIDCHREQPSRRRRERVPDSLSRGRAKRAGWRLLASLHGRVADVHAVAERQGCNHRRVADIVIRRCHELCSQGRAAWLHRDVTGA